MVRLRGQRPIQRCRRPRGGSFAALPEAPEFRVAYPAGPGEVRRHRFNHRELFAYAYEAYSRVVLHGPRKARIAFAEKMQQGAFSFPRGQMVEVAALVMDAARARNGWRVIRDATVIHRVRGRIRVVT